MPDSAGWETALVVSTSDFAKFDTAQIGPYVVTLGISDLKKGKYAQGQLTIVDTESKEEKEEVLNLSWQSLSTFKGIETPGYHGFTGLMYLNKYAWPSKGKPELQFSCRVR